MRLGRILSLLAVCTAPGLAGCHQVAASASEGLQPPVGETWLTAEQAKAAKIEIASVEEQAVDEVVMTAGRVTFEDNRVAHVFSPVTGRVTTVNAALGQHVKKGDLLAALTSPDSGQASADLHKAEAELMATEHSYNRKKELYEAKACSAAEFEASEDAWRQAKAERSRASQKAKLLRAGSVDLITQGYALSSPIDGEVIARNLNPGIEVQGQYGGGQAVELFTIGQLDKVWVMADVYESDLARINVGAKVTVGVLAYANKSFEGTVDWVSGTLDPQTRTARVRCTFDNPDHLLKSEMYANVRIAAAQSTKALAVPRSAVVHLGEQTVVFLQPGTAADGRLRFERLPVTVDDTIEGAFIPVSHGLEQGARIVTHGAEALSAAM